MVIHASYFPSTPGPTVRTHLSGWATLTHGNLFPPALWKTLLKEESSSTKKDNTSKGLTLKLNLIITKYYCNRIIFIITEYTRGILFCFMLYKDTQTFKVVKWLVLWTQVEKNTICAWKANRTKAVKPHKTVKYETNSAVFVTRVRILRNTEGIADIPSEQYNNNNIYLIISLLTLYSL